MKLSSLGKKKKKVYAFLSIMSQKLGHCGIEQIAALKKGVVGNRRGKDETCSFDGSLMLSQLSYP